MSTSPELIEVAATLNEWRAHKKTKFERIPRDLLARVRGLRGGANSDREICKVTGLAWNQLHPKARKLKSAKPLQSKAPPELIELPPLVPPPEVVTVEILEGARLITIRVPASVDAAKLLSGILS